MPNRLASIVLLLAAAGFVRADDPPKPKLPDDGQTRIVAPWTTKGQTINPVAICFDPAGNLYVAESDRAGNAVQDTRHITNLNAVEEDLKFKSIDDRRAQIHRWLKDRLSEEPFKGDKDYFTKTEDRVRVLSDLDGKGLATQSKVFAGGFNDELDGIAAGVLWLNNTLYFTCIPHVWALPDRDHNLQADKRESLSVGYGVRWCFYGHDLHGLTQGPDGRIYFSMGDRGFNITTKEGKHLIGPDRGGVFRCLPDGSGLELIYQGLRNPQELAFNDLGDLFTGDNNCDSGDKARIVHIVEGGDSGWRQDVQSLDSRGPWNRESICKTLADVSGPARPAWTLPPVEYMCDGPSGFSFYPGTGESHKYDGFFFLVDFYGSGSTIHAFKAVPQGAGFKIENTHDYYKGVTITDIAWGNDGRLYMSDWGGGWDPNPNGLIYTITNKTVQDDPIEAAAIKQVGDLIKAGFAKRPIDELLNLLSHRDQRIRLSAQYELAARGEPAISGLASLAAIKETPLVTRAHAIWCLGQIARRTPAAAARIGPLLSDDDAEIRTQATRTLGDLPNANNGLVGKCISLLKDSSPRVRLAAATALGKLGDASANAPLLDLLADNNNADLNIRHAAAYALSLTAKPDEIARRAKPMNAAARLGAVLALRRQESDAVVPFLADEDPAVTIEAARAIYDFRMAAGMPKLAALLDQPFSKELAIEPLLRRAIEANVHLGTKDCAARLAAFTGRADIDSGWRLLALERLEGWDAPLKREGVWGNWADYPARPAADVEAAINANIQKMLTAAGTDDKLLARTYRLQVRYALHLGPEEMASRIADPAQPDIFRLAVLDQLAKQTPELAAKTSAAILESSDKPHASLMLRAAEVLAKTDPDKAATILTGAATTGPVKDRQQAVRILSEINSETGRNTFAHLAQQLRDGKLDRVIALDIYEPAMKKPSSSPAHTAVEPLGMQGHRPAGYSTTLLAFGGDAENGKKLFLTHPSAECIRCHTVKDVGGTAGPDLSLVSSRLTPDRLVESLIEPNTVIAKGYGNISAMPPMAQFLSPHEARDIVAFLQSLRPASSISILDHETNSNSSGIPLNIPFGRLALFTLILAAAHFIWRGTIRKT